jgi:uncharacterized membrane protein YjfL (UPF0719 family)
MTMEAIQVTFAKTLAGLPAFAVALALFVAGKYFYRWTSRFDFDDQLTARNNPAFGVTLAGYLLGLVLALAGAFFGLTGDWMADMLAVLVFGVAAVLLMRVSVWINDRFILYTFSNTHEIIHDRNMGTGFVVAGGCVATGLIINGVLSGNSDSLLAGLRDTVLYWALGQVVLIAGGIVFQKTAGYAVLRTIEIDDNLAAGLSFGGFLVALGCIIRAAVAGASSHTADEIFVTLTAAVIGLVILGLARIIVEHLFMPRRRMAKEIAEEKNPAAGAVSAACFIAIAILLATAINPPAPVLPDAPPAAQAAVLDVPPVDLK